MTILIINKGADRQTLAAYYANAFRNLKNNVTILDLFYENERKLKNHHAPSNALFYTMRDKLPGRLMRILWQLNRETHKKVLSCVTQIKPDIILIFGNTEIGPDLLGETKENVGSCAIFLYLSDPLPLTDAMIKSLASYDCIFTFSKFQVPLLYWFGAKRVEYLPFGYDPRFHAVQALSDTEKIFYGSDISYLGTWQPHIELWINELTQYPLKIWGNQWYKSKAHTMIMKCWQGEERGLYHDMARVIGASKIVFNVIRYFNGSSHSMKTFEIPACGGFMLANRTEEQLDFFAEDKCAVYFSTKEELKDKIRYYLNNDSARMVIAQEGLRVARQHTYIERAKKMLDIYQRMK